MQLFAIPSTPSTVNSAAKPNKEHCKFCNKQICAS